MGYNLRMIIDTHCHLVSPKYPPLEEVRAESLELGVGHCITQGTNPWDWEKHLAIAEQMPDFVSACLAVHPSDAHEADGAAMERMAELCRTHRLAAIGETGLDYFWDAPAGWSERDFRMRQWELLELHYALAAELGLNISLHTRDKVGAGSACFDDAVAIARQFPGVRPVFHCFIGSQAQAELVFGELNGMISFTGLLTFKKTEDVQAVAAWCPLDRFMVETDSPYLSPEPFRGKLNIPGRTRFVVEKIAALRGMEPAEIAAATTRNACSFFRLPQLAV